MEEFKQKLRDYILCERTDIGRTTDIFDILLDKQNEYELTQRELECKQSVISFYQSYYQSKAGINRLQSDVHFNSHLEDEPTSQIIDLDVNAFFHSISQ